MASRQTSRRRVKKRASIRAIEPRQAGTLVMIGGREDRGDGEMRILREVARLTGSGRLVVASAATSQPKELFKEYRHIFGALGVKKIDHLFIETPDEARKEKARASIDRAATVFFTGGDQLKITTKIGGSPVVEALHDLYSRGGTIAGTSAGASVMGETMPLGGASMDAAESHKVGNWNVAPGLGLVKDIIIDQHFGQRGRIGRLLGAIALNPRVLGVGIDEDTAIVVRGQWLRVLGSNAVYIVDGHDVTFTNMSESEAERTMSVHDVRVHILAEGESFHLGSRRPSLRAAIDAGHASPEALGYLTH